MNNTSPRTTACLAGAALAVAALLAIAGFTALGSVFHYPDILDEPVDDILALFRRHELLGKAIGETIGYALTATFTVLVVVALRRLGLPRWLAVVGCAAAILIATGVVIPIVPATGLTNFLGYVVWCAWLLALAVVLFRLPTGSRSVTAGGAVPQTH